MNWRFCVSDPQKHALALCRGSMDEGDGWGYGCGYSYGDGWGDGSGYGSAFGDGEGYGWGYGDGGGYGDWTNGDGFSSKEWV